MPTQESEIQGVEEISFKCCKHHATLGDHQEIQLFDACQQQDHMHETGDDVMRLIIEDSPNPHESIAHGGDFLIAAQSDFTNSIGLYWDATSHSNCCTKNLK